MNENLRAAVDLITREVQAAGTGLRGMSAPILGVDGEGDHGDRLAILLGDPDAPIAQVRSASATEVVLILPGGSGALTYRDDRGKTTPLYAPGDRYVLYNDAHFVVVRVGTTTATPSGDVVVTFAPDKSNPRPKFGDYRFDPAADANGALFARLDEIVTYRYDRTTESLERRENHGPWAEVARGIIGFQVRYRALTAEQTLSERAGAHARRRAGLADLPRDSGALRSQPP
jgi:hypothetical protein